MTPVTTGVAPPPDVADIIDEIRSQLQAEYARPRVKRDAHPKPHGCVQATFTIHRNIPNQFNGGVFADVNAGHTFKAWVRFSNAFRFQHDLEFETRGMAVKLLHVTGNPLPEAEVDVTAAGDEYTQDFLLATHDAFFLPDPADYVDFLKSVRSASPQIFAFYGDRWPRLWRGFVALVRSQINFAWNPLALEYRSQVPYQLGPTGGSYARVKLWMRPTTPELRRTAWLRSTTQGFGLTKLGAVKFALLLALANAVFFGLEPLTKRGKAWAEDFCDRHFANRNLLRVAMARFLAHRDATFELWVQPYTDDERTPIDDASRPWRPRRTGFPVATLRIPRQAFWPEAGMTQELANATNRMVALGENMSFNPWHGLDDHTPLGRINEVRRWIYRDISAFRRRENHVQSDAMPRAQAEEYDELAPIVQF